MRGHQRPGLLHLPEGSVDAGVGDALYLLGEWGFTYDEAQELVIRTALLEQADGRWAAKELGLEEPRQNGKGEVIEGRECLGLFYLDERKLIHSAHEFATATEALDRMDDRISRNPKLKRRVKTVKRAHGDEGIYLKDGRTLRYKTRTKGGGRGFSADLLILDEAMFIAEAFLGALMPVISARPNPQMWYTGSAVDQDSMDHGVVFARLRQRALSGDRDEDGKPRRMAYLGWSPSYSRGWATPADVPQSATADPDVIAEANPALGIRIDLEHVVGTERPAMDHRTFCVERLGVGDWPATSEDDDPTRISAEMWAACHDPDAKPAELQCLAFDVRPNSAGATIVGAAAGDDGIRFVKVLAQGAGTGWIQRTLEKMVDRYRPAAVLVDERSPANAVITAIENAGIDLEKVNGTEYAAACGTFFDSVGEATVRHDGDNALTSAARNATRRNLGEAWAWSRTKSTVDISPLVAATLALRGVDRELESVYESRGLLVINLD